MPRPQVTDGNPVILSQQAVQLGFQRSKRRLGQPVQFRENRINRLHRLLMHRQRIRVVIRIPGLLCQLVAYADQPKEIVNDDRSDLPGRGPCLPADIRIRFRRQDFVNFRHRHFPTVNMPAVVVVPFHQRGLKDDTGLQQFLIHPAAQKR